MPAQQTLNIADRREDANDKTVKNADIALWTTCATPEENSTVGDRPDDPARTVLNSTTKIAGKRVK